MLGAQPSKCVKKGGIWTTPGGIEIVARTGHWNLSAPEESPGDLDRQVTALFSGLSRDLDAWRRLAGRFRGNIFAGLFLSGFNEGLSLSPTTLQAIGQRGLVLDLDIYGGDEQELV